MSLVSRLFLPKGGVKANGQLWVRTFKVGLVPRLLAHLRFIKSMYCSRCIAQGRGGWGKKMLRNSSEYSAVHRLMDKHHVSQKLSATIGLDNYLVLLSI